MPSQNQLELPAFISSKMTQSSPINLQQNLPSSTFELPYLNPQPQYTLPDFPLNNQSVAAPNDKMYDCEMWLSSFTYTSGQTTSVQHQQAEVEAQISKPSCFYNNQTLPAFVAKQTYQDVLRALESKAQTDDLKHFQLNIPEISCPSYLSPVDKDDSVNFQMREETLDSQNIPIALWEDDESMDTLTMYL